MLAFPYSFLVLPGAVALGLGYLKIKGTTFVGRLGRGGILALVCTLPFLTSGPGQAQVLLGLLVGYLGMRMASLARRGGWHGLGRSTLALIHLEPLFQSRVVPWSHPRWLVFLGLMEMAACVFLLWLGYVLSLWQASILGRLADDLLVLGEVAVGAAGIHHMLVGSAALLGHHVRGLQERPHRSASLSEFWGQRWNRLVQCHLAEGFFRPVLRSGYPRLAVVTAFFASGVFHLLVLAGGGPTPILLELAIQILGFFLLHSALVLVEYRLGWNQSPPQSWPLFLARARTLILVTLLSPILLDPFARLAHVHGRQIEPAREPTPIRSPAIARVQGLEREQYLKQAR